MRYYGAEGLRARIREHIRLARTFAEWIDASPEFERMAPAPFSTVCFRAHPTGPKTAPAARSESTSSVDEARLDQLNQRLLDEVNAEGKVFLSHTKLRGKFTLRLAIGNIRTSEEHVELAKRRLESALKRLEQE